MVESCSCPCGGGKCFVKGDGKDAVIKENEEYNDSDAEYDGKPYISFAHGKNASEHVVTYVGIHAGGKGNRHDTRGECAAAEKCYGGVAFDAGAVFNLEQEKSGGNAGGNRNRKRLCMKGVSNGKRGKAYMGKTVSDHGVPFQNEARA